MGNTTAEMQDPNTFVDASWDFNTPIWKMCVEPDYPRLWWEQCPMEAEITINPTALNLRSSGKWISCEIRLAEGYNAADIDPYSVFLEDEIQAEWIWFNEKQNVVMAKFTRSELAEIVEPGEVELAVTGFLVDGTYFEGKDTITVIDKGRRKN
jgi:hypothetical protein